MLWYKIVGSLIRINVSVCRKCSQWCSYWTQKYFGAFDLCAVFFSNCWKHHLCPLFLQPLFLPFSYHFATSLSSPHTHTPSSSSIFHTPPPHPRLPSLSDWCRSHVRPGDMDSDGLRAALHAEHCVCGPVDHEAAVSTAACWPWTWRDWKWLPCWWSWSSLSRFWSGLVYWQPAMTVSKGGEDVFSREEPLVAEVETPWRGSWQSVFS